MELVEFLLARIAETQNAAQGDGDDWTDFLVADCEAKRRIVGLDQEQRIAAWGYEEGWAQGALDRWREVLQLLALPYADHEDYRAEWKP